jgi:hypothetical protein
MQTKDITDIGIKTASYLLNTAAGKWCLQYGQYASLSATPPNFSDPFACYS